MPRHLLALWVLLVPFASEAQSFQLRPPSIGDALSTMDRLDRREVERKRPGDLDQVFILPERPGQNQVAWFDFRWEYEDVPPPGGGPGGIRLYFYRSETAQARKALPAIQSAYARLVEAFHYNPTKRIPYILYATQREFQTQNVFQVTESVLGVTSPQDLKMTVPYFGDHSKFIEVSTHEMVHQFTIQKLLDQAGAEDMVSPINFLPLWFIEGIAEYYSKGGIDVETDLYLRDLVWNPDPRRGYEVLSFAEDRLRGYIPTYKLGQARIAFIAEEYGREKIQAFLENAYLLGDGGGPGGGSIRGFGALVRRVLNEPMEQVDARWKAWLKRRYYPEYMRAKQDLPQLREIRQLPTEPEDYSATSDGTLMLVRGIDRERGRARLYLLDTRNPRSAVEIASDSVPGIESLHPIEYGVTAISNGVLAFSAQAGIGDTLYVQRFRHIFQEGRTPRFQLGKRHALKIHPPGGGVFVQIGDPTFSADASHIAFVGVSGDGQQDIYVVPVTGGEARRLTNDGYAERDLAWGPDGIYCTSDATDHGRMNLFRIDAASGARTRLTTAPATDRHPRPQADGSVLFSSDANGKPDLYLLKDGTVQQLTDFTTGLTSPSPAPKARGIFAATFYGGYFKLVEVPKVAWLDGATTPVAPPSGDVLPIPQADFSEHISEYDALSIRNWRPEAGFVYGGGAGSSVAGRAAVLFSDMLRDHVLFVDLSVYGSFNYTQALVLFENRARRRGWVLGAFHFVQQQLDPLDPNLAYYQRDFGVIGALRYPLDRFRRLEFELTLGGVQRYCLTDFTGQVFFVCQGISSPSPAYGDTPGVANLNWQRQNGGVNFTMNPAIRYGYDSIRYDQYTGPLAGSSLLLELGGGYLPGRNAVHGFARVDAQHYWQIIGRSNFELRFAGGTTFSPNEQSRVWERSWWITSADNLRGYSPGDLAFLIGQHYYIVNAELQFPLDTLIRLLIFDYIEGVAAFDFGGVFNKFGTERDVNRVIVQPGAWESRTLTGVLGFNVLFGPLLLRVHFGHPFDIGGLKTPALLNHDRWVTNITLRYFFF
ncbi:TolB-like translocation protein [Anaeromyxobacter oryzae]|uniref:WD40 domain protein beta Propeller n=1 Tax=Anaeromyxobacter oryzae TaxID=2918170 RepID=A0ABM7WSS7_9BACT|nr:hypothetical protein [Anaeromyxobacter oryzae]BDG02526.1 hypothetical protein AMOR_15220 [Anaeromyxobacter oryzae]